MQKDIQEIHSELISIAAGLALGNGMPSECPEDWRLPKGTPQWLRREIIINARVANKRSRDLAYQIRGIANKLLTTNPRLAQSAGANK